MSALLLAQAASTKSSPLSLLFPVLLFGALYFFMIRPQRTRAKQHQELMREVSVGDEVETIGGMFGTVSRGDDDVLWLDIAPGTTIKVSRAAVRRKIVSDDEKSES